MPLVLSDADQRALARALRTALSPLDHESPTGWSMALARDVASAAGVDGAAVTLPEGGRSVSAGVGWWTVAAMRDYADVHHQRTTIERRRLALRADTWTRSMLTDDDFTRSIYYNEWCRPHRILDSAGMSAQLRHREGTEATCHIVSERSGRFEPDGREQSLLRLLQPAFAAGARLAAAAASWFQEVAAGLDRLDQPMSVHDAGGRRLHSTPALLRLAPGEDAALIAAAAERLARAVGGLLARRSEVDPPVPVRVLTTRRDRYELSATLLQSGELLGSGPMIIVSVLARSRTESPLPSAECLRARHGFTAREAEVALLLATGRRNSEIAVLLGASEHTARRHTERVLAKLGVHTRAAVAAAIRG